MSGHVLAHLPCKELPLRTGRHPPAPHPPFSQLLGKDGVSRPSSNPSAPELSEGNQADSLQTGPTLRPGRKATTSDCPARQPVAGTTVLLPPNDPRGQARRPGRAPPIAASLAATSATKSAREPAPPAPLQNRPHRTERNGRGPGGSPPPDSGRTRRHPRAPHLSQLGSQTPGPGRAAPAHAGASTTRGSASPPARGFPTATAEKSTAAEPPARQHAASCSACRNAMPARPAPAPRRRSQVDGAPLGTRFRRCPLPAGGQRGDGSPAPGADGPQGGDTLAGRRQFPGTKGRRGGGRRF